MSRPPEDLPGQVSWLMREIAEMKRRERNRRRTGRVIAAKPEDGLYKVRLREEEGLEPYETGWLKAEALAAGGVKIQADPVVGQIVTMTSESGDLTDAVISLSSFNDENTRPHGKNGELMITVSDGAFSLLVEANGDTTLKAGKLSFTAAAIEMTGPVQINGDALRHNAKNVGDTHKHGAVMPGPSDTDVPTN